MSNFKKGTYRKGHIPKRAHSKKGIPNIRSTKHVGSFQRLILFYNYVQPGETIRTMDFMAGAPLKEATMDLFMVARLAPHFPALSFL